MAKNRYDEDLFKDSTMTFGEHLEELRRCLFKSAIGLAIGFTIGLLIGDRVIKFFEAPLTQALERNIQELNREKLANQHGQAPEVMKEQLSLVEQGYEYQDLWINSQDLIQKLREKHPDIIRPESAPTDGGVVADALPAGNVAAAAPKAEDLIQVRIWTRISESAQAEPVTLNVMEPFMMWIKASLVAGVVISAPWIFYQIWAFVAAGLYPHEKHYIHLFLPFSLGLFLLGAATAYLFVFEPVLDFLFAFSRWFGWGTQMRMNEWMSFVLLMPLGFGVSFQLPLVMLFVERIGIVTADMYVSKWRIAVLAIFVLAMVLTPSGDPYSMMLMAFPLTVLYWGGILLCRYMPRAASPHEEFAETR